MVFFLALPLSVSIFGLGRGEEVNICSLNRDIFALSKTNIFEAVPIREDTGTATHLHFWKLKIPNLCCFFLQFEILFMKAQPCLSVRTFKACAGVIRGWIRTLIRRI